MGKALKICKACQKMSERKTRACATCRHHRQIGAPIPSPCVGCIHGGECTKWVDAGGEEHETD